MSIAAFGRIRNLFSGASLSEDEQQQLVKEALVMTLARATRSDSNIKTIEVETVRRIIRDAIGEEIAASDIRVAASAELFETRSLQSALGELAPKLQASDKALIVRSLAKVIKADSIVSEREVDYFNRVANALMVSPADLVGLTAG